MLTRIAFVVLVISGLISEVGCGSRGTIIPSTASPKSDVATVPGRSLGHGHAPVAMFQRRHDRKRLDGPIDQYALIVMQPGTQCGESPPSSDAQCTSFLYPGPLDQSCGSLNWYVDSSALPAGASLTINPTATSLTGSTYVYANVAPGTVLGKTSFSIGATCTNAQATGELPGPGSWDFGVVTTDIVNETVNPPTSILAAGFEDAVGQEESLQAVVQPSDAQPFLSNPTWSIPFDTSDASSSYVNGYTQSADSSSIDTSVALNSMTLHFFPIVAYGNTGKLTFSGDSDSAGTAFKASATYKVDAPTVTLIDHAGSVQLGSVPTNLHPVITAGPTIENGGAPGIRYQATFTSPNSFIFGVVGMTQLASISFDYNSAPNGNTSLTSYGTSWYDLDGAPAYGQLNDGQVGTAQPELTQGGTTMFQTSDDPDMPLYTCTDFDQFYGWFQDYFYFIPEPKTNWSSIPVTIGTNFWQFQAYGTKDDAATTNYPSDWNLGVWEDVQSTGLTASSDLPSWSNNVSGDENGSLPSC